MINPDRVHRLKAVITKIGTVESRVLVNRYGRGIIAWTDQLPKGAQVGDPVNIQVKFSIMLDQYVCVTVRKVRTK